MIDGTYEKKLKIITNKRIIYFFAFKLLAFYISSYLIRLLSNTFLFNWINFESF